MSLPKIQFMVQVDGASMKKDRTMSLKLGTQEMSASQMGYIMDMAGKLIWCALAETEHEAIEVPEILPEFKGDKTVGQRMRGIIYRIWKEKTDQKETFPRFYESKGSQICEWLIDKYLT